MAEGLLERTAELRQIGRAVRAAAGGEGGVVVLAAAAGLGKTVLLEASVAEAEATGVRPLVARATELEQEFAFGVARQLLEDPVLRAPDGDRASLLSGAARHAAAVLDLDPDPPSGRDIHTTLHGLYWLLVNLASASPLVVAVDDVQWADEPSQRWLAHLARRLERVPVALVVTARTDAQGGLELPDRVSQVGRRALEEVVRGERALRLEPRPLSAKAVGALLRRALETQPDAAFADACHAHTGGNAFLVSELAEELAAVGVAPDRANARVLEGIVPDRVGETTRRRLSRLSPDARRLAEAIAVLGDGGDLALAAELAGMPTQLAGEAVGELVTAHILDEARALRFRHPLLRSAVYAQLLGVDRARAHGQAARLLAERGAPAGRIAAHLLQATPAGDRWVVEQLRAAARTAAAQGVPEQAATLLRRALSEGPPDDLRATVTTELAFAALAGLEPDAPRHLAAALETERDGRVRAELAARIGLAHVYSIQHEPVAEILLRVIDEIRDQPDLRESRLQLEAIVAIDSRTDLTADEGIRQRVHAVAASLPGATPGERLVQAISARGRCGPSAEEHARALLRQERASAEARFPDPAIQPIQVVDYALAHRPDHAQRVVELILADARDSASPMRNAQGFACRGVVEIELGDLLGAEADLTRAVELMRDLTSGTIAPVAGFLVHALAERGRLQEADALLEEFDLAGELPQQMFFNRVLWGRGVLRLAQGRFADAAAEFAELGRRHTGWGFSRPTPPWRSGLSEARLRAGDRGGALDLAAEELEIARVWDTPRAIAVATRAVAIAGGREDEIAGLAEAVELLDETPFRLDRARARCDLGAALRRAGRRRDARAVLAQAMDEAHACGADPLAERAADELRRSGARPRRRAISGVDALTPSERRVAELAAAGRSNREVAEELFVTTATVETHLSRIYRKLGLAGRDGLGEALSG
ncbi:MAG TPA: AAA family ATPase [Thermoleophilaceae bacterium]